MLQVEPHRIPPLAREIRLPRAGFTAAYDVFAASWKSKRFIQIAEEENQREWMRPGRAKDERDFAAALLLANEAGWLVSFVFDKFAELSAGARPVLRAELQSIVNRTQRFVDAKTVEAGTIGASRRSCQIVCMSSANDHQGLGSGFLIGPHLVMTNYHVISSLVNNEVDRPGARFDYHHGASPLDGPEVFSCVRSWLRTSSPAPKDAAASPEALRDALDYAVIELEGLPGYARGWYDLTAVQPPPAEGGLVEVWQFPSRQPMKVLPGNRVPAPAGLGYEELPADAVPPRIHYMLNTLPGSSGGLVLDNATKAPVAIHDAGYDTPDATVPNRGIPLSLIAAQAASYLTQALLDVPPDIGWHPGQGIPIIGRNALQRLIFRSQRGDVRILAIVSPPDEAGHRVGRLGRTFTRIILEACLPATDHHLVDISAARIDPDPFLTAQRLVQTIDPGLVAHLPPPSGQTTLDADLAVLVEATVRTMIGAVLGKTLWLMIDDIDAQPIGTQWGAASFLIALYRRAALEPRLRIVLVGLPRELEGLADLKEAGVLLMERLDQPPNEAELIAWVQAHLGNREWPSQIGPRLGRLITYVATERSGPKTSHLTEEIARLLAQHARRAFRGENGGG
ncbi:trypsin-like serine peptidase [Rubellimicrobium arenae]|uniref:trypsin-like serine peptidase n=1 Tax=Rubellimicrobium arenae TaxID=2817372 RepID=UPI001B3114BB|nr:serine protease [Rubellimicrobium arenae]